MDNNKIKHLEFIQSTITRMNQNSFQIKGWMNTLVSALLALYASSEKVAYILIAIVPAIVFWLLKMHTICSRNVDFEEYIMMWPDYHQMIVG